MTKYARSFIVIVLFLATQLAANSFENAKSTHIAKSLSMFPKVLDSWHIVGERSMSEGEVQMLGVDEYVDYTYANEKGETADLYISYFSSLGVSGEYHSPMNCMPGSGWNILKKQEVPIDLHIAKRVVINEMFVSKEGQQRCLLYWYQGRGRVVASEYKDRIYLVLDSILLRRREGAFIRIMTNNKNDESIKIFAATIVHQLDTHMPKI